MKERESLITPEQDPQATRLWVIRHGPTQWNKDGMIQGNVDNPLLDEEIMPYLSRMEVTKLPVMDRIVTSHFTRAKQTAAHIRDLLGWGEIPMHESIDLGERKWGIFEGKKRHEVLSYLQSIPEIVAAYPDLAELQDLSPIIDAPGFRVEGSETMDEVTLRVTPVLTSLRESYPGENILVAVHAGVIISQGMDHRIINEIQVVKNNDEISLIKRPAFL